MLSSVQRYTPEERANLLARPAAMPNRPSHCLMCHLAAPQLLLAIERWALAEWERNDSDPNSLNCGIGPRDARNGPA